MFSRLGSVGAIEETDAGREVACVVAGVFPAQVGLPLIRAGSCSHSEQALLSRKRVETGRAVRCPLRTIRRRDGSVNQLLTKTADFNHSIRKASRGHERHSETNASTGAAARPFL